ncbi:MAG: hypothetical protein P8X95_12890 [Anaerolineales bacterium]
MKEAWQPELEVLTDVASIDSEHEALDLARRFLEQRGKRRAMPGMDAELVDFERQREWLEGMKQATLLDWIMPDWKPQAMEPDSSLEDLLRLAVMR